MSVLIIILQSAKLTMQKGQILIRFGNKLVRTVSAEFFEIFNNSHQYSVHKIKPY
jgi:hypothetical protein